MVAATTFFIDDSGTRHPDHSAGRAGHGRDWFALGGILINDEDIPSAKQRIVEFRERWPQMANAPLHSVEIRGCHSNFRWLGVDHGTRQSFFDELEALLLDLPVIGLACVVDRPGYNARYRARYGRQRWALCKTAFAIAVERASKYAVRRGRKLRVYVEQTDKKEDRVIKGYYDTLRSEGSWFNPDTSGKYNPIDAIDYKTTLYEFRTKNKSSPLMQIADLFLWPMCIGGYDRTNHPYRRLVEAGKLIDCALAPEEIESRGIKYSCFDEVHSWPKNTKAEKHLCNSASVQPPTATS